MNQTPLGGIDGGHTGPLTWTGEGEPEKRRRTILVHSCCGPCSTSVVERLARDRIVTIFFYNPNITDENEYKKRLEAQRSFVEIYNSSMDSPSRVGLIVGPYDPGVYYRICAGYEDDPEGGKRCERCISLRLVRTAEFASLHGFDSFTTTLSVSPHKDHSVISAVGGRLMMQYGVDFLAEDFKKNDGYARSIELSCAYGLYRQTYCGCDFARR
ncbi:MAG: epoxyqueuosine reductase QueH [Clostridiales Family XIII bacterium]|jgi:predicted adenine nucleotide alpha hydrolase (AANH) superfamily ATPase|nr:epoxyqueuosine reductase QueH [Clostridiales Family XIII bacterium]